MTNKERMRRAVNALKAKIVRRVVKQRSAGRAGAVVQSVGHSIAVGFEPGRGEWMHMDDMVSHHDGVLEELQA